MCREHDHLKLDKNNYESHSRKKDQEERWKTFLGKWDQALDTYDEVLVVGDANIDLSKSEADQSPLHRSLNNELKKSILI